MLSGAIIHDSIYLAANSFVADRGCAQYSPGPALFLCLDGDEQLLGGCRFLQGYLRAGVHVCVVSAFVDMGTLEVEA